MRTFAFAIMLGVSVFVIQSSAQEQRCNELGASCICSEPFGATGQSFVGGQNPPDTTTKQCGPNGNAYDSNSGSMSVPIPNPPPGSTAQTVYLHKSNLGDIHTVPGVYPISSGVKRMCIRIYHFLDANHPLTCAPNNDCNYDRIKLMQVDGPSFFMQAAIYYGQALAHAHTKNASGQTVTLQERDRFKTVDGTSHLRQSDLNGHWFRTEYCMSGDLGKADGRITGIQWRVDAPTLGLSSKSEGYLPNPNQSLDTRITNIWIGNLFRQHSINDGSIGYRYHSYAMQAEWSVDENQYIGPACEMEGGCGEPRVRLTPSGQAIVTD